MTKIHEIEKSCELKVVRNFDYTITVIDNKNKRLKFRDICGKDLEFLESLFTETLTSGESTVKKITFDEVVQILNYLSIEGIDFKILPYRISVKIFKLLQENILVNYMPKYTWLIKCFALQNGSFSGVNDMEMVPMTKFVAMIHIHQEAMDSIGKNE